MSELKTFSFDWFFLFQWIMATTLGSILGRFLIPNLAVMTVGIATGIFQWLVLLNRFRSTSEWIISTTLGISIGSIINQFLLPGSSDFLAGTVLGVTVGTAQWLVLRRKVHYAGWWIPINISAWTTGTAFLPGFLSTGAVVGLITGVALDLLLHTPKKQIQPEVKRNVA